MLLLALPLLVGGLFMPAISITSLAVFSDTYSIAEAVFAFWEAGKFLLFAIVGAFSLILPSVKIAVALLVWWTEPSDGARARRLVGVFARISKWSMLDVFIVALTVLAIEGSLISTADIHIGVVLFAASVVLSTLAIHRLAARRPRAE